MTTNVYYDCLKLMMSLENSLKDSKDRKEVDDIRKKLFSIINKNFPEMETDYYKKIIN